MITDQILTALFVWCHFTVWSWRLFHGEEGHNFDLWKSTKQWTEQVL